MKAQDTMDEHRPETRTITVWSPLRTLNLDEILTLGDGPE
jgi:hypothetical protein